MKTMLPEQMEFEDATGADSLEKGIKAYKKSDYIQALGLLCPIAEKGNILAQSILGRMYLRGEGVIQNYQEAAKWHCLAGKQGDKYSQHALGSAFYYGVGVTQDYQEAAKWYRLAAKSCDDKSSQYHLNLLYSTGQFISRKIATSY